jgi:4-amino-4-deoxy-L-arabinose transferase-like glycosyltransferase
MKRSSSFSVLRWLLILTLVMGLLSLVISFLPFETLAHGLNRLASDGNLESFTVEKYQALSKVFGLFGLAWIVVPVLALFRWADTKAILDKLADRIRAFNDDLRHDALDIFKGSSLAAWSRSELMLMGGLILVAVVMRLASLNVPLAHDEAYTYNAFASRSLWVTISDYHLPNNHVFLTIIINILTHAFGNPLWLIRLPTTIAGILTVPAAYVLGKRLYSKETGFLSAGLVTVFPILVEYSVLARGYAFVDLFTVLILIYGDQVRQHKNRFIWLLLVVTNALGFYTIPIMLFPFGALYIWLFLSCVIGDIDGYRSKLDFLKYWLISGFASAFLTVFLYAPILIMDSANFFGNSFVAPVRKTLFRDVLVSRLQLAWDEWMHTIPNWLVALGVIGFALSVVLHLKISKPKIPYQLTFFLWIGFYLVTRRPDIMTRMWLYLAAPLLIWSAGGMIETLRWVASAWRDRFPLARVFLGVSLAAVFVYGAFTLTTVPARWSQKSSVEMAALYFKDTLRDGDLVTASAEFFPQLRYYFGQYGVNQNYLRKNGQFERAFIVIGNPANGSLEEMVPMAGVNSNRPMVNLETVRVVRIINEMTIYEGDPVP